MTVFAGDPIEADDLNEISTATSVYSAAVISPLVSVVNTPTQVASLSYTFKQGVAYRITVWGRFQINGATTSSGSVYLQIRRASATGTLIHDPGAQGINGGTGFCSSGVQACVVKCTVADTTQTISFSAAWSGTGTSLDVESASSARAYMTIQAAGAAADHTGALEVPTS